MHPGVEQVPNISDVDQGSHRIPALLLRLGDPEVVNVERRELLDR